MKNLAFSQNILNNGLRFINIPTGSINAASVLVLVKAGSRYEYSNLSGIAHFLEHMFFKGGKKFKSTREISTAIDGLGGIFNAMTDKEEVGFFIKLPSKKIEVALDILSDMFLNSKFYQTDIDQEKKVIIEEINMYEDTPMFQTNEFLESILYKGGSLGRRIIGNRKIIESIKQKDFINFTKQFYFPENIVIVTAGETKNVNEKMISRFFNFENEGKTPEEFFYKEDQAESRVILKSKDTEQSHFSLGFRMPEASYHHEDYFKAKILSVILGEGMSSRMFLSIREEKGLAYRISSSIQSFIDTGYLDVSAGVDNKQVLMAIKAILFEFQKIRDKKIDEKELDKSKEYLKGKLSLGLEESLDVAFFLGRQEILTNKILNVLDVFKKINDVTAEDIFNLANKRFIEKGLNIGIIGPVIDEELIRRGLKIG